MIEEQSQLKGFEMVSARNEEARSRTACQIGDIAELKLCVELRERGCEIFTPFGHATKVDLIVIDPKKRARRVQVKKASKTFNKETRKGKGRGSYSWYVNTCQVGTSKPAKDRPRFTHRRAAYSVDDFDVLAVYSQEYDMFLFFDSERVCGKTSITLGASAWRVEGQRWELLGCEK